MGKEYNLLTRTGEFGLAAIRFAKTIAFNPITSPIINQLIRAATSVGANYAEANEAISARDFVNKLCIAKKEAKEVIHWLKMLDEACKCDRQESDRLKQEAQELVLIMSAIIRNKS